MSPSLLDAFRRLTGIPEEVSCPVHHLPCQPERRLQGTGSADGLSYLGGPGYTVHVVIMDRSESMRKEDFPPSRLGAAIDTLLKFVRLRESHFPDDAVGLVAFNSRATIVSPVVFLRDTEGVNRLAEKAARIRPWNGTDLSDGLHAGYNCLFSGKGWVFNRPVEETYNLKKRFICLTDGQSQIDPLSMAGFCKSAGNVIEIIGIGGSPAEVNEASLKACASWENGKLLYRFIGDGDVTALQKHFTGLALE